jgi:hypothetical protein
MLANQKMDGELSALDVTRRQWLEQVLELLVRIDGRDGASQRVNVTCVTPLGEEVASTL